MLRRWLTYEQMLLAKLTRSPLSTTPRERMLMLSAIRLVAFSLALLLISLLLIGLLSVSASVMANWVTGAAAGAVTFVVGLTLLTLAMAISTVRIIVYGD